MYRGQTVAVGMPAYNEAPNVTAAVEAFRSQEHVDEVVVVDNNSTDDTAALAEDAGAEVVEEDRQGYGFACRRALAATADRADLLVLVEPDGTFVADDVEKLLAYALDFDFVVGTRTAQALIWEGANMGAFLRWGNFAVAKLLEVLHNTSNLTDVGCTYRLIHADAYRDIAAGLTVGGSHFSPEMLIRVAQSDHAMIEIPVNYRGRQGESKITGETWPAIKLGVAMLALVIRERFRSRSW